MGIQSKLRHNPRHKNTAIGYEPPFAEGPGKGYVTRWLGRRNDPPPAETVITPEERRAFYERFARERQR